MFFSIDDIARRAGLITLVIAASGLGLAVAPAFPEPRHGIAMHGEPVLPPGFEHLPYARPDAPKGGRIVYGVQGTFDTLNPFVVRGIAARGLSTPEFLVFQPLMARSFDEPFSLYGLVAQSIDVPDDRSSVTFRIDPRARFSDGKPITAEDVLFSWSLLKEKGKPNYRGYYAKVTKAEVLDPLTIRFDLTGAQDRELPLILALMPVLPQHATDPARFEETTLTPPIGSGPYVIAGLKPGESITYRLNPDYWARDLPISRGLYNSDEVRFDYFRDANSLFEAFKGGLYDIRIEDSPTRWTTGYDFPAIRDGRAVKDPVPVGTPKGMTGFVFNTRRALFGDVRVREALGLMFDFDWVNRTLFNGVYKRTGSYFEGSDLSSSGQPALEKERALLAGFPGAVRDDVMAGTYLPHASNGSGRDRDSARQALALLAEAGWLLKDGTLRKTDTDKPFSFEFLVASRVQERLALNFAQSLQRIGIVVEVRLVDDVQYWRRVQAFDFDMMQFSWGATPSPGNEQYNRWGTRSADRQGSLNFAGARSPAVDAMIEAMLAARERPDFVAATRALDRVLLSGFYVVPLFHVPEQWIARTSAVKRPQRVALFGFMPETVWRDKQ